MDAATRVRLLRLVELISNHEVFSRSIRVKGSTIARHDYQTHQSEPDSTSRDKLGNVK